MVPTELMDDRRHVQIIIAGMPGSGKTTVKELVAKALRDAGLGVTVFAEPEDEVVGRVATEHYVRAMVDKGHTVAIQVRPILAPISK